jgi:hypothetical protein
VNLMSHSPFKSLLDELETVLLREREALRVLDQRAIEETTSAKLVLDERITSLASLSRPSSSDRTQLARVQRAARINQLLLVHARSCVQGALKMVTGEAYVAPNPRGALTTGRPVALNIRG